LKKPLNIFLFLILSFSANAQDYTHEVGIFFGSATIQTDYGQRGDFSSSYGASTLSFSFAHYLHFFNRSTPWNYENPVINHLMIKSELNYMSKRSLQHHGKYVTGNSDLATQLRAMTGTLSIISTGIQAEYYLNDLQEFMFPYSEVKWNPYMSLGFKYSLYTNTLNSELGDWENDITVLPTKYRTPGALNIGSNSAFSLVVGTGTRYKLSEKLDLAANFNWQYFFSDGIDGLQADASGNRYNEWLLNFQFGVVYHLNFAGGIFYPN
jgi:hypothetical protein